jgi:hypothetical protein
MEYLFDRYFFIFATEWSSLRRLLDSGAHLEDSVCSGNECSFAENPSLKTESELRACAIAGDQVSSIQVSIDGRSLQNLQHYIVQTPLFNMTLPNNNIFGAPNPTQSVSHAYLTFLQPLPSGNHEIHFNQVTLGNPATGTSSFAYDITYHLVVD